MSYTALYRKFRPDNFDDVKGQDHIVTTLTNQIKHNRIGHAYLFCGTRGTGKTTVAKILAKAVNCQHPVNGSPCGECDMCKAIQAGTSMNVIEIDAASNNGVDNIREIREEVAYRPTEGNYKVYIIDEVHMLSTGAFNALLKTLEEPPSYVIFILATTEAHKIPITILSRCQRYDFHRITIDTIAARLDELLKIEVHMLSIGAFNALLKTLEEPPSYVIFILATTESHKIPITILSRCQKYDFRRISIETISDRLMDLLQQEGVEAEEKAVRYVAKAGDGSMRDALSLLDQCIAFYLGTSENPEEAIDVSSENLKLLREESEMVDVETLMRYIRIFSDLSSQIRYSTQKRVLVEIALIKLCRPAMETNLDSVLDRLRVLEQRMDERPVQQVFVQPGATGSAGSTGIGSYGSAEAMAAAPEKAAPEDLQKIVASWKVIVGQTSGIFKQMLQKSIPKYNGQTGEPVLYIEFQDFLGKTYVDNPEAEEELKNIILAQTGKSVELKMVVAKEHNHTNLAKVTVDQALRENIHMDVVVEEDPDDAED